jgi:hypothetical protein
MLEFGYVVELMPVYADKDSVPVIIGRQNNVVDVVMPAKLDKDMELMETVLHSMGNSATSTAWRTSLQSITSKNGKEGWSDATFKRKLKEFKERHPELTGGQSQGDPYSLGIQPIVAVAERMRELGEAAPTLTPTGLMVTPVKGGEPSEPSLNEGSSRLKLGSEPGEPGSSQGRAEGENSPALTDECVRMMRQLDHLR